jgi:dUTPase
MELSSNVVLRFVCFLPNARAPIYSSEGAVGLDLSAAENSFVLAKGDKT